MVLNCDNLLSKIIYKANSNCENNNNLIHLMFKWQVQHFF